MDTKIILKKSLLSEASYADFGLARINGVYAEDSVLSSLIDEGFSETQADEFLKHWRVVDHQPNTFTGFSATLFETLDENAQVTGKYSLAIRGAEIELSLDLLDNLVLTNIADVGADGIALNHAIGLFNFYQKLVTPTNKNAIQLDLYEGPINPDPGVLNQVLREARPRMGTPRQYRYLRVVDSVDGLGAIPATAKINVTGHSLGGHLALILSRLKPGNVSLGRNQDRQAPLDEILFSTAVAV